MTRRSFLKCLTPAAACIGLPAAVDSPCVKSTVSLDEIDAMFQAESERMSAEIAKKIMQPSPWMSFVFPATFKRETPG